MYYLYFELEDAMFAEAFGIFVSTAGSLGNRRSQIEGEPYKIRKSGA